MAHAGISALEEVLKERGIDASKILQQAFQKNQAVEDINRKVAEKYAGQLGKLDENKKQSIQALADLDSRMSKIFGKGGKYELTRASDVENLTSQRHTQGLQDFNRYQTQTEDVQKQMFADIDEAVDLYHDILKESQKTTGGTGKSETDKLRKQAGLDLTDQAGIYDSEAITIYLQASSDFQKWWLRNKVISGGIPEGGFTLQDVQMNLREWERRYDSSSSSLLDSFFINQNNTESDNPLGF